jgi:hypothetical protein
MFCFEDAYEVGFFGALVGSNSGKESGSCFARCSIHAMKLHEWA